MRDKTSCLHCDMRAFLAFRCAQPVSGSFLALAALSTVLTLLGCSSGNVPQVELAPDVPGWLTQPERALPQTLSQVGLYPDANLAAPHPWAIAYEPAHSLWSNGSAKRRYIVLPEGTSINTTLSDDWDFPEGIQTQLERFAANGILSLLPTEPAVIAHEDPTTQQVLEYFEGNCVHCHNGADFINSAFDLRHPMAVQNLVNQETQGEAIGGIRVVPGAPEESALFLALSRDGTAEASQAMPPVGVQRVDQAAVDLLRQWIVNLQQAEDM